MKQITVQAKLSRLRTSPRKVRMVADLIRHKPVEEARQLLKYAVKGPARPMAKLLESAVATPRHNFKLDTQDLSVHQVKVDEGPTLKRFLPSSRGRVSPIHKKTSHITLVLAGKVAPKKEKKTVTAVKSGAKKVSAKKAKN